MSQKYHRGLELRCIGCHASLPVGWPPPREVTCEACGQEQEVEPGLRREAELQGERLEDLARGAAGASRQREVWERFWTRTGWSQGTGLLLALVLLAVVPVGTYGGATLLADRGLLPLDGAGGWAAVALGAGAALFFGWFWLTGRSVQRAALPPAPAVTTPCPACGAPVEMLPGPKAPRQRCGSCQTPLLPPAPVYDRAAEALARHVQEQRLAGLRAERAAALALLRRAPRPGVTAQVVCGLLALAMLLAALLHTFAGGAGPGPALERGVLWLLALLLGAALLLLRRHLDAAARRVREPLAAVARTLDGALLDDLAQRAGWLEAHWTGSRPSLLELQRFGVRSATAALRVAGFPVLVDLELSWAEEHEPRGLLLLAWSPPAPDAADPPALPPAAAPARRELEQEGLSLEICQAGLLASATPEKLRTLGRSPTAVLGLARAVVLMARIAGAARAAPAPAQWDRSSPRVLA